MLNRIARVNKKNRRKIDHSVEIFDIFKFLCIEKSEVSWLRANASYKKTKLKGKTIYIPEPRLKKVQKRLAELFSCILFQHYAVCSYSKRVGVKQCLSVHASGTGLLKTDIVNFFGHISRSEVVSYLKHFVSISYIDMWKAESSIVDTCRNSFGISSVLAAPNLIASGMKYILKDEDISAIADIVTHLDSLPIGAPTSPILSNTIPFKMDLRINNFAKHRNLTYTRYADDILVSSYYNNEFYQKYGLARKKDRHSGNLYKFLPILIDIISYYGFTVNRDKTSIVKDTGRKSAFGITVNRSNSKSKTRVDRKKRRKIRAERHQLELHKRNAVKDKDLLDYRTDINERKLEGKESWVTYIAK